VRLAAVGASVDRTDREGALWYELDASGARRLDWSRGEAFQPLRPRSPAAGSPLRRANRESSGAGHLK
jgi:hypothetical protein